jgi:hypothetical protein
VLFYQTVDLAKHGASPKIASGGGIIGYAPSLDALPNPAAYWLKSAIDPPLSNLFVVCVGTNSAAVAPLSAPPNPFSYLRVCS